MTYPRADALRLNTTGKAVAYDAHDSREIKLRVFPPEQTHTQVTNGAMPTHPRARAPASGVPAGPRGPRGTTFSETGRAVLWLKAEIIERQQQRHSLSHGAALGGETGHGDPE